MSADSPLDTPKVTAVLEVAVTAGGIVKLLLEIWHDTFWFAGTGFANVRVHAVTSVPVNMIVPLTSLPSRLLVVPQDERFPFGLPVITCPVLSIEKRVVVAEAVEEPIAKRVVRVEPATAFTESCAKGVVEPIPRAPFVTGADD